uniref:6-phosphofructo-2-kinase domain-containing protein n=1 Tax=Alexandrium catenella TaxID=2925 RepID=A0A7S1SC48_ALECA
MVFVMVGLPARGKSFISLQLTRFLNWMGFEARVFNAGNHRRTTETGVQNASYFDPKSTTAAARRDQIAFEVLDGMLEWMDEGRDRFAVFDATNSTQARRRMVAERLQGTPGLGVIFVESICDDDSVLEANIALKLSKSPDYARMPREEARQDLLRRISHYETVYEPLEEEEMTLAGGVVRISYIKLLNFSSHVVAHNIWGRAAVTVLPYLMALHVGSRPVWLVRLPHAEVTAYSWRKQGKPWPPPREVQFAEQPLSPQGHAFVDTLAAFIARRADGIAVFTCTHRRGLELAERLGGGRVRTSLNPQDRGICFGLTAEEVAECAPDVLADPLHKRFAGGESLADMLQRLVPTLIEVEQEMRPVLVAAPLTPLQALYCYYAGLPVASAVSLQLPMHTLIELQPSGAHFTERRLSMEELCGPAP